MLGGCCEICQSNVTAKTTVIGHWHNKLLNETVYYEIIEQEAQLSPRDRAMCRVNWNVANCQPTVQKLIIRQVLTKSMAWSWRFSRRQCVIDNVHSTMTPSSRLPLSQVSETNRRRWVVYITCIPTTCCGEIFQVHNVEIAHVTLTTPT